MIKKFIKWIRWKHLAKDEKITFDVVELTMDDYSQLTEDEKVYFALVCHVANECNVLRRLQICCIPPNSALEPWNFSLALQWNFFMRTLSAKVFELVRSLEKLENKCLDEELKPIINKALAELRDQEDTPKIAEYMRNETSNHVPERAFRKNLRTLPPGTDFCLYFHKNRFNSFFPFGEEAAFASRLHRHVASDPKKHDLGEIVSDWAAWVERTVSALNGVVMDFALEKYESGKFQTEPLPKEIGIPNHMIGGPISTRVAPIIAVGP